MSETPPTSTTTTTTSTSINNNKSKNNNNNSNSSSNNKYESSPDNNLDLSFKTCLNLLSSKVDEERFVGIILVKNLIKPDDSFNLSKVYEALGIEFLYRLLQTPNLPGNDSISYHNVAVTILSTFTSLDISNVSDDQIESTLLYRITQHSLFPQILQNTLKNLTLADEVNLPLYQESIMFLYSVLSFESKLKDITATSVIESKKQQQKDLLLPSILFQEEQNIKYLGQVFTRLNNECLLQQPQQTQQQFTATGQTKSSPDQNNNTTTNKTIKNDPAYSDLFKLLIRFLKLLSYLAQDRNDPKQFKYFEPLLEPISVIFKQFNNPHRFSFLPIFISIFQLTGFPSHPNNQSTLLLKSCENIREGISSIFQSKKQKESHRDKTIILFSIMLDLLGSKWVMTIASNASLSGEKMYQLACQFVRTEVQIILHSQPVTTPISAEKSNLLIACYSILDNVILFLVSQFESDDKTLLNADTLLQLRKILIDTNTLMIEYLKDLAEEAPDKEPTNIAILTLKQVGQFLAEEAESMSEVLSNSLHLIFEYFLKFKNDHGFYLAYLLPGIENYIDVSSYTLTERSNDFFNRQQGHYLLVQFLNNYLPALVTMAIEQDQNVLNCYPLISSLKSYGCTPELVGNTFLPHACSILYFYMSYWNNPISPAQKSSFFTLLCLIADSIEIISTNIHQALGDAHKDRQIFMINLILVSLSILKYLDEDDFNSTQNQETLLKAIDEYIGFYQSLELPPADQSAFLLWEEIKVHWLNSLDLLLQCLDKYPTLRERLSTSRWPPPDFNIPTNTPKMDSQTVIEVNRSVSQIIRKLITLRNNDNSPNSIKN